MTAADVTTDVANGPAPVPTWHDTASAVTYTGRHADTIRAAAQAGTLRGYQTGPKGRWRFHRDDLDRWVVGDVAPVPVPIDRRRRRT